MRFIFALLPAPVVPEAATTTMSEQSIMPTAGEIPSEIDVA
jgi:hypothetical protein